MINFTSLLRMYVKKQSRHMQLSYHVEGLCVHMRALEVEIRTHFLTN